MNLPPPLYLLFFLLIQSVYSVQTCYWPDGTPATEDVPCSDEKYASCCRSGNLCLSNNLCLNVAIQPYVLSRGACTDPNWDSDNCPQYCTNVSRSSGSSLFPLGLNSNGLAEYCCNDPVSNGSEVTCNSASGSPFFVPDATLVAGYAALANVSSLSASTSASNSTSSSSSSSSNSRDVAIGAGVGVPLGVIALGAIAWALWERRARTKGLAAAAAAAASGGGSVRAGSWAGGYGAVATSVAGSNSQYGIQQYETGQWKNAARPAELTTSARTHELAS
ncbi:hypothetical protein AFCA_007795 [Aspergillus flavus]|uniref:DNA, SC102 n=1 Tax=Aspergillus oryzae (strain ATCC 42149 / RIB 40) TaxID=510516 RepID=Q2UA22_ASPOR|nr:unnamed protein product [Aspergillus oryzae RIB40]KOC07507.1 hypothetical protein AFLA70_29g004880 [Aspergillus flavus AF70]UDD60400.1 hypothetical protein AFCA_007795 [Aspergillus flavus]BAE61593.1 unnamed protein product [Aspergillus oryzae RIB40]